MPRLPVPRWIRKSFRTLVGKKKKATPPYRYHPDHTVIAEFGEFAQLPVEGVEACINDMQARCRDEWERTPGTDFASKSKTFYSKSENYIFDLLAINLSTQAVIEKLNTFDGGILEAIRTHPGRSFLEFGGGTGVLCEVICRMGKDVTYLDIPGRPNDFASWRFKKHGLPIRQILTTPDTLKLENTYDIVYTDAVIEHLPALQQEATVAELARALNPGGLLILLVDLGGESEELPMHAEVDIRRLHTVAARSGLVNRTGKNRYCSLWTRPS